MARALRTNNGALTGNPPLSYVICWQPRSGPAALQAGHASLIIDSQQFLQGGLAVSIQSKEWYASWLSRGGGSIFQMRSASHSYGDDMLQFGGERLGNTDLKAPTKWVALRGLDRAAMKEEWDRIAGKRGSHWKILDKNCASIVVRLLKAGGGDQFAAGHKNQLVWWPSDVMRYARSMGNNVFMTSGDNAQVDVA